jgi:hypothetical protein
MARRKRRAKAVRHVKRRRRKQLRRKQLAGIKFKKVRRRISDTKLQRFLTALREHKNLAAAAKAARTNVQTVQREAKAKGLIKKTAKGWIVRRDLHRQMLLFSGGQQITVTLPSQRSARNVGKYMAAVGQFVRSNDLKFLVPFIDRGVTDVAGKRHPFETNPNALYRLTSSTDEAFEQVYRIVVN